MKKFKTCAMCGVLYVGTYCPNCGSDEVEEDEEEVET